MFLSLQNEFLILTCLLLIVLSRFRQYYVVRWLFVIASIAGVYSIFFFPMYSHGVGPFLLILIIVLFFFVLQKWIGNFIFILSFVAAILVFVFIRYVNQIEMAQFAIWFGDEAPGFVGWLGLSTEGVYVGLSYLLFKILYAATQRGLIRRPLGFQSYLGYIFYFPSYYSGPMTFFNNFENSFLMKTNFNRKDYINSALRIFWGLVKYFFFASFFYQITFSRLLLEPQLWSWAKVICAFFAYPPYLYFSFSGLMDIVIGFSGLINIKMDENFDRPYLATSVSEFWQRWHMTLTRLLNMIIYKPISLFFIRTFPLVDKAIAPVLATTLVFMAMAEWHGASWNYFVFALLNSLAIILENFFKSKETENKNVTKWLKRFYVWCFLAFCYFFFENSPVQINKILSQISVLW